MNLNKNLRKASKTKNDEFYTQLKDIEKELRHYKNQLAEKAGIHLSSIKRYETNKRLPEYEQIILLSKALNITPNDLLGFKIENRKEL